MSEVPLHSHSQPLKTDFFPPKAKPLTLAKPTARRVGGARGGNGLDRRAEARRRFCELPLSLIYPHSGLRTYFLAYTVRESVRLLIEKERMPVRMACHGALWVIHENSFWSSV